MTWLWNWSFSLFASFTWNGLGGSVFFAACPIRTKDGRGISRYNLLSGASRWKSNTLIRFVVTETDEIAHFLDQTHDRNELVTTMSQVNNLGLHSTAWLLVDEVL